MDKDIKKDMQATGAAAFRQRGKQQQEGELLTLTTGNIVKVRRPSITLMVSQGHIPADLAGSALKFDQKRPMSDGDVKRLFELKVMVCKAALVSPKIVDSPTEGADEITIDDLVEDEINDIYMYVQVGLHELERFRQERQGAAAGYGSEALPRD